MGGVLLALQAVIANKRAVAIERAANAQADAAKQQAKANQNTEQGQRQERLKNAIEHLDSSSDSLRLGGIYELFHLAEDTIEWRQTILDIFCAHIRRTTSEEEYQDKYQREPSEEIQSLLTLLFVQGQTIFRGYQTNLVGAWLNGSNIRSAQLQSAKLNNAHLQGAHLEDAQLQGATLNSAKLQFAWLSNASLQGADVCNASLQLAQLGGAQLQGAFLIGTNFQAANLAEAKLQGAILQSAMLQSAFLTNTNLQGVTSHLVSESFRELITKRVGMKADFSRVVVFGGYLNKVSLEFSSEGMPTHYAQMLQGALNDHVDKPIEREPPDDSGAITGPPYTQADAERWIAGYEEAVSAGPWEGAKP